MTNGIVLRSDMQLMVADSENEIKQTARKLLKMSTGGGRLSSEQAVDLAVYSIITGLNPFNGECYWLDKVGPIPGIAGYRVKAQEWLIATSDSRTPPRVWEEYREATTSEADFDPDAGDIAWVCTLTDSVSKERWEQRIIELGTAYHKMGATFKEAHDAALQDAGPCPSWSAVGVVKASEHFSKQVWEGNKPTDEYKPEMWDRNERAKKRAAKGCYRKGFPSVSIPDMEYGDDVVDAVAVDIKDQIAGEILDESQVKRTAKQNLKELGYGNNPDPIDDASWDKWLALCLQAEKLDIGYPNIDRENTTKADLRAGYQDLEAKIKVTKDGKDGDANKR